MNRPSPTQLRDHLLASRADVVGLTNTLAARDAEVAWLLATVEQLQHDLAAERQAHRDTKIGATSHRKHNQNLRRRIAELTRDGADDPEDDAGAGMRHLTAIIPPEAVGRLLRVVRALERCEREADANAVLAKVDQVAVFAEQSLGVWRDEVAA